MKYLLLCLFISCLISCGQNKSTTRVESTQLISEVLTERVSPLVSINDNFVLRFKKDLKIRQSETGSAIKVVPNIKFDLTWIDDHTLSISPLQPLNYDQSYAIITDLSLLIDEKLGVMTLKTKTKKVELQVSPISTHMKLENGKVVVQLTGTILSNQYIQDSDIEKMLFIDAPNDRPSIDWSHFENNTIHDFIISGIVQQEELKTVEVEWGGGPLNEKFTGQQNIQIDGTSKYMVQDIELYSDPNRQIVVHFNQPLKEGQDLNGLIWMNGNNDELRTLIDGNRLKIYPNGDTKGILNVRISKSVTSFSEAMLKEDFEVDLNIEPIKPQLRLSESGVIVVPNKQLTFPFEAVNIDSVDVEIFKIYDQNVLQFMQNNDLSGDYNMQHVGTIVHKEKVSLKGSGTRFNTWTSYALDLQEYLKNDQEAIYQIRIGFRPSYVLNECANEIKGFNATGPDESIFRYQYYGYEGWDNPCSLAYYTPDKFIKRNVLLSNVAGIVKRDLNQGFYVTVTNLTTGTPLSDASVTFFDAQKIQLTSLATDSEGLGYQKIEKNPSFAIIHHAEGTAYLNLRDAKSLSVSDFDTGGKKSQNALEAFIYTDRGVYRPGDSIHMHVIVDDADANLPLDHPLSLSVMDPQGIVRYSVNTSKHLDRIYTFTIPTDTEDATGAWRATVNIGSVQFHKQLRIETIKPNRLRLSLNKDNVISYSNLESRNIGISSSWLHGAPAANLKAKIDAQWKSIMPSFSNLDDYTFSDPARSNSSSQVVLYEGILDANGNANFNLRLDKNVNYPSMLKADITNRVFEKGGDFSETYGSLQVSPYDAYVGVSIPKNQWGSRQVKIGDDAYAKAVVVGEDGLPLGNRKVSVGIYDIQWEWWYYRSSSSNIYELNSDNHSKAVLKNELSTDANGRVNIPINTQELDYGRKLIRVCDKESGHCTGQYFYASGWQSEMGTTERNSMSKLSFNANKSVYTVGEEVELSIPSEEGSKILISLESDQGVLSQEWMRGAPNGSTYKFRVDQSMSPNIYAHVMLLQPYDLNNNDLPMRMYGVLPIMVEDPESSVVPKITVPSEIKPKEKFDIKIGEEKGRAMTYTINIVDEGLLDLTNFRTPNPHAFFYAKKSLGVKTWDIYDQVLYGLNNTPDKIISIGGDGEVEDDKGQKKAIRFKPVVFSAGPFKLSKGQTRTHSFEMPNYIGSVRTMVVARDNDAYGSRDISIPVKTPLMVLPTLPRVISQGEQVSIPVSVFAMQDDVKNVQVSLNTTDHLEAERSKMQITFDAPGEKVTNFNAEVSDRIGIAKIEVSAISGQYKSNQQIEIDVRNPNPITTAVKNYTLEGGERITCDYETFGMAGTNKGIVEFSLIPAIRMADRLEYLVSYPYGCLEQTTSSAFVQLYLKELTDYVSESEINKNVQAGIDRIVKMQSNNGGFNYWPSNRSKINEWSSSYAGHFLQEAKKNGYYVSPNVLRKWVGDQRKRASKFNGSLYKSKFSKRQAYLNQAYRLYTLSLNGTPELSAMNNLRVESELPATGKYLLAAAYALSNKSNIALDLIANASTEVPRYRDRGFTFGSEIRDMALIAQSLSLLDRKNESYSIIKKIADHLNSSNWYSTQSIAFGLMSLGKLSEEFRKSKIDANIRIGTDELQSVSYDKSVFTMSFNPEEGDVRKVILENKSDKVLFASLQISGQKPTLSILDEPSSEKNVSLKVKYKNLDGAEIDVSTIPQGTDFLAEIEIVNKNLSGTTIEEMALTHIIPSGWEIRSGRLNNVQGFKEDVFDYRDIRDDRVHTFFNLSNKKKFILLLNATYKGEYFLPPLTVEAMYDKSVFASTKGQKVMVTNN